MAKLTKLDQAVAVAHHFVDDQDIIYFDEAFYRYADGIWVRVMDALAKTWLMKYHAEQFEACAIHQLKEIIAQMAKRTLETYEDWYNPEKKERDQEFVNLSSKRIRLRDFSLHDYTREAGQFHKLPWEFDLARMELALKGMVPPLMNRFLSTSLGFKWDKKKKEPDLSEEGAWVAHSQLTGFLQEYIGYLFIPGNPMAKNLIITGPGGNGKSTLGRVITLLLGEENVTHFDLKEMNSPTGYFIPATKDKLLNVCEDVSFSDVASHIMKAATAGEKVTGREIHKGPITFDFTAKFIILCNQTPLSSSAGEDISRRFFLLPMDKIIPEEDRVQNLASKIIEKEGNEIFSWAMAGLKRIRERGMFLPHEIMERRKELFLSENMNSVSAFIEDCCQVDDQEQAERKELMYAYNDYCRNSGQRAVGRTRFYTILEEMGYQIKKVQGLYYFKGLKSPYL